MKNSMKPYLRFTFGLTIRPRTSSTFGIWLSHFCNKTLLLMTLLISSTANATVLYSDDFERSNSDTAGGAWTELEADSNDIAIYNERLRLRDYLSGGFTQASFMLDTSGYNGITLELDWQVLSSTEASDSLNFGIAGDFSSPFWTTGLGSGGLYSSSIDLSMLDDLGSLELAFWIDVNSHTETIYLNKVMLTGNALPVSNPTNPKSPSTPANSVVEPSSIALMGMGILSLVSTRRCNKS